MLQTLLLLRPSLWVTWVKYLPSYLDTPPSQVPNQIFPFLSCNMQSTASAFNPCSLLNELKFCGLCSLLTASGATTISGMPARTGLLMACTFLGTAKESLPGVQIFGVPANTVFGIPARWMLVFRGTTVGLSAIKTFGLPAGTDLGIAILSLGTK